MLVVPAVVAAVLPVAVVDLALVVVLLAVVVDSVAVVVASPVAAVAASVVAVEASPVVVAGAALAVASVVVVKGPCLAENLSSSGVWGIRELSAGSFPFFLCILTQLLLSWLQGL